ncbi:Ubiquitin carboxyl-terminal hydrolase MINDY-2 [Coemansia sp. RSA 2703]|nr:Ubiquitin carboxyl-terminal hydrolase MINDY-2 [Coemansia sp. RSA 2703]KAJ2379078.1 Ubiquitin carboxyl-terminal hydrolase MINDY-2 [Coemansia sp. RSA 2607]KAJ2398530.1 Ubiquitin carboxyl-terminal hydrolase MINDY-2 [Coemansia sp. RSA 2603]
MTELNKNKEVSKDIAKEGTPASQVLATTNIEPLHHTNSEEPAAIANATTEPEAEKAETALPEAKEQSSGQEYRLKSIQFRDHPDTPTMRTVLIVTQNENGPCPLISLANTLALQGTLHLHGTSISDQELVAMLGNALFSSCEQGVVEDGALLLDLLPELTHGLDVELQFSNVFDFAESPATRLFRAFGVMLVHGWVADGPVMRILRSRQVRGYDALAEYVMTAEGKEGDEDEMRDAAVLRAWLEDSATQLTDTGLRMLGTLLPDHGLAVLFRNNHFSTLYKRGNAEIYTLCTDDAVAGDSRIVWESLSDIGQTENKFVDSQFVEMRPGGDYVRDEPVDSGKKQQEDEDYALAMELQRQDDEERRRARERLQVRQGDRLPPGMHVKSNHLYGVPEVEHQRLAQAVHRSKSDENFARRMNDAFLPHESSASGAGTLPRQKSRRKPSDASCILC